MAPTYDFALYSSLPGYEAWVHQPIVSFPKPSTPAPIQPIMQNQETIIRQEPGDSAQGSPTSAVSSDTSFSTTDIKTSSGFRVFEFSGDAGAMIPMILTLAMVLALFCFCCCIYLKISSCLAVAGRALPSTARPRPTRTGRLPRPGRAERISLAAMNRLAHR